MQRQFALGDGESQATSACLQDSLAAFGEEDVVRALVRRLEGLQSAEEGAGADDELLLEDVDRREQPRAIYQREVTAQTAGSTLVLLARDLSQQGMRIDSQSGLRVGQMLRLTIFGGPQQRPAVVPARVTHDDGEQGMVLSFEQVAPQVQHCLDEIVTASPAIEVLTASESGTSHMVVVDAPESTNA